MARRDRYIKRRGQARLMKVLLFLSAVVVLAGLAGRIERLGGVAIDPVTAPTATPIAAAYDETMETRELTLTAQTWYALQTGIFSSKEAAQQCAEAYVGRGAPGLVVRDGDKYRVLIASYGQQADATAVRERLAREQQVDTYLYAWGCPELTLRLTGMVGQLDVAAAGLTLAEQTAALLRDMAISMDAGVADIDDARALIVDIDAQMSVWADTARKRFVKPYPGVIDAELSVVDQWTTGRAEIMQAANNATGFSAALKCEAMRLYAQAVSLRATLGG